MCHRPVQRLSRVCKRLASVESRWEHFQHAALEFWYPNPYLAAFKVARAFFTSRAGISATALAERKRLWAVRPAENMSEKALVLGRTFGWAGNFLIALS